MVIGLVFFNVCACIPVLISSHATPLSMSLCNCCHRPSYVHPASLSPAETSGYGVELFQEVRGEGECCYGRDIYLYVDR